MKKKKECSNKFATQLALLIVILTISSILIAQDDFTINVNGSQMYFSVGGNVHWKYYNTNDPKYKNRLYSYHLNRNKEIGHNAQYTIAVNLPDSLLGDNLKIKKGFYAVNVDSIVSFKFNIHNFTTEFNTEGGGHIGPYFNIPKQYGVYRSNLFILSPDRDTLDKIKPISPVINNEIDIDIKIADLVSEYFSTNENAFYVQYYHDIESEDMSITQFKKEQIKPLFKLSNYHLNNDCYYVVGSNIIDGISIKDHQHKFLAIVNNKTNKIIMLTNTHLYNTFRIDDETFFYYQSRGKHSGAVVFTIAKISENDFKVIFMDGSYSM